MVFRFSCAGCFVRYKSIMVPVIQGATVPIESSGEGEANA